MIRAERVGEIEIQEIDTRALDYVIEIAKIAKESPEDLRKVLVETISRINTPVLLAKE